MREVSWCSRCNRAIKVENRFGRLSVKIARRLIGQQELGTGDERAGQSHPLLLSARKLA